MKILVLNCGSSSVKYQLLDMANNADVLAKGIVERIGNENGELTHKPKAKESYNVVQPIMDHTVGVNLILEALQHENHGVINNVEEIDAVGHRVVHGGEKFSGSVRITQEIIDKMEECSDLAPLHNPANLKGIYAMKELLPNVPQCGVFDTAFHQTMPEHAYMYGIPYELYEKYKIRRYGFHGASHRYVSLEGAKSLNKNYNELKIITCHLGNGASIAAINNGKSVDTSMGLTPVEGLIMGTRCGDFDLGALLYIMDKENLDIQGINKVINKQSGMLGISGVSHDMRDITGAAKEGNHRAKLSLEMYAYRIKKYIGSYIAAMGGIDLLIFTGGIGENVINVRKNVCENMAFLGIKLDEEKNSSLQGVYGNLTHTDSKADILVVPTNEELVIAQDTVEILNS